MLRWTNFRKHTSITWPLLMSIQLMISCFYTDPNDYCQYFIKLCEIPTNMAVQILNDLYSNNIKINYSEYIFFFKYQINNRIYQVTIPSVPSDKQKENLRFYLTEYLNKARNLNSSSKYYNQSSIK